MSTLKILHHILPSARIQLPSGQKSSKAGFRYANRLSKNFQKEIAAITENQISFETYKNILAKVTDKDNFDITLTEPRVASIAAVRPRLKLYQSTSKNYDAFLYYEGFSLLAGSENGKLSIGKECLVHETRHLFDMMCNPKIIISRGVENIQNDEIFKKHEEILNFTRDDELYKPKRVLGIKIPSFEKELREKLADLDNDVIVTILQQCRYHVKTEKNAYKDYKKFFLKQNYKNPFAVLMLLKFHIENNRKFEFDEKERVLKKLIKEFAQNYHKSKLA